MSTGLSTNIQEAPQCIQFSRYLIGEIQTGRIRPGEKLGSVRSYAARFQVGRQVVLSAFSILLKKKLIRSENRRGYFVCGDVHSGYYYRMGFFMNRINLARSRSLSELYLSSWRRGWELIPGSNYEEDFELSDWLSKKRDLDGVIVSGIVDSSLLNVLEREGLPYVIMGNYDIPQTYPQVRLDSMRRIGAELGAAIRERGIRNLTIVCGPDYLYNERYLGETLQNAVAAAAPDCRTEVRHVLEDGYPEICRLMRDEPPAAFCFPGEHCMGWHRYCQEHHPESPPVVFVVGSWASVLASGEYDVALANEDSDFVDRTVEMLLQQMDLQRTAPEGSPDAGGDRQL